MSEHDINPEILNRRRVISTVIGTLGGILVIALLIGVMLYATRDQSPDDNAARDAKLAEVRAADAKAASEYSWIDKTKGTVRLPIDVAIEKSLAEGFKQPSTAPVK